MMTTTNQLNSADQTLQLYGNSVTSGDSAGTQNHPFNFAYNMQNHNDVNVVLQSYEWATEAYGTNHPMPEVLVVNHEHMQRAAQQANHHTTLTGQVYGWYSQLHRKVFISDRIKPSRTRKEAAILVHEFIHWFQHLCNHTQDV